MNSGQFLVDNSQWSSDFLAQVASAQMRECGDMADNSVKFDTILDGPPIISHAFFSYIVRTTTRSYTYIRL